MRGRIIARIARWEITTGASGFNRQVILVLVGVLVLLAVLFPVTLATSDPLAAGLYRAGVSESSVYYEPLQQDPKFVVTGPDPSNFAQGNLEVLIVDEEIHIHDTQKGRAAGVAFESALETYNNQVMEDESDHQAAFPVSVQLRYVEQNTEVSFAQRNDHQEDTTQSPESTRASDEPTEGSQNEGLDEPTPGGSEDESGTRLPSIGSPSILLGETSGSPTDITPPFPFISLVLAFAFVVPMNFVIQAYSSSILHERRNRRGELLLVAPIARSEIVVGKTLPYFLVMIGIAILTAIVFGGGIISVLAVVPIALLFLACAFVGGVLARSQKELTFILVTTSVVITTYLFVPAIFTHVHPVALISPLTLVIHDLEGAGITVGSYLFSTGPVFLAGLVLFGLGLGMFRAEDLFAQRGLPVRVLDAIAVNIRRPYHAALMSAVFLPFVFVLELLALSLLFILPVSVGLPVLLVVIAAIEETAKSVHVYAGFTRGRYSRTLHLALRIGVWSGFGFFLGEKSVLVAQLVGLSGLELGWAALEITAGIGGIDGALFPVLVVAPLILHISTAIVSASGAGYGPKWYVMGLGIAIAIHTAYNLVVVNIVV